MHILIPIFCPAPLVRGEQITWLLSCSMFICIWVLTAWYTAMCQLKCYWNWTVKNPSLFKDVLYSNSGAPVNLVGLTVAVWNIVGWCFSAGCRGLNHICCTLQYHTSLTWTVKSRFKRKFLHCQTEHMCMWSKYSEPHLSHLFKDAPNNMFFLSIHVYLVTLLLSITKGNRRRSIGHCPHLWNPLLQPIHHSQQSYCLWYFAVQAGMVAVETYIDVGNILWIFYDCLCHHNTPG